MNLCILSQCTSSKQDYHSRCIYIYVNIYIDIDIDFSYIYNFRYFLHLDAWPRKLKVFLEDPNKLNPKFTRDSSEENVAFLDLKVKLKQGKIETDLHVKSTDRHQYLHYTSSHPEHTKRSIVFSQSLRISRICSQAEDFRKHTTEMRSWFYKRGYPKGLVEKEMGKVKFSGYTKRNKNRKERSFLCDNVSPES